jgi:hypothetical protein
MTDNLVGVYNGNRYHYRGRCSHKMDFKLLPKEKLLENEEAIRWLAKKGMPHEKIAKLNWNNVNREKRTICWYDIVYDGEYYKEGKKHVIHYGKHSPFLQIADRGRTRNSRVFYKTITRPNTIFPEGYTYNSTDVALITAEDSERVRKLLTEMLIFGNIEVA